MHTSLYPPYSTNPTYSLIRSLAPSSASLTQYAQIHYSYRLHLALSSLDQHHIDVPPYIS
jgi:hypothetical protein